MGNFLTIACEILRNMGPRYVIYRGWYEFMRRTGLLAIFFPTKYRHRWFISLEQWRKARKPFFFASRHDVRSFKLGGREREELKASADRILSGDIQFFNGEWLKLGTDYDWVTNPKSGFRFNPAQHWTKIEEFRPGQGDIKYVWEKSRFCYLYTIIRNDLHFGEDHSEFVFKEILSWISANPVNCGPNWKCSQEISLRVLNWIFALNFYADSPLFDQSILNTIAGSISAQVNHVERNLSFSRIALRNNHTMTEALCLYTVGIMCQWLPHAKRIRRRGKRVLEQEALHQIYDDGSYIQHSMNYERVVAQLYTWALSIARVNSDSFSHAPITRLNKVVEFLYRNQDENTGFLPNYGANDGSIFFPLSSCNFRDYRPQINALHYLLNETHLYGNGPWQEDVEWFGAPTEQQYASNRPARALRHAPGIYRFPCGGYYVLRASDRFAFIRCSSFRDRPSHADNLHLDLWFKGSNIVRDCGSYLYNTDEDTVRFFMGTRSHNTVIPEGFDQMRKGPRFIWYNWSRTIAAKTTDTEDALIFEGEIEAFGHVAKGVRNHRIVKQYKGNPRWDIRDMVINWQGEIQQIWNISPDFFALGFTITAKDANNADLTPSRVNGWYSNTYGEKEAATQLIFSTTTGVFRTVIMKS